MGNIEIRKKEVKEKPEVKNNVEPERKAEVGGMSEAPEQITSALLEVVVMPQGEVICLGKTVGWVKDLGKYLTPKQ